MPRRRASSAGDSDDWGASDDRTAVLAAKSKVTQNLPRKSRNRGGNPVPRRRTIFLETWRTIQRIFLATTVVCSAEAVAAKERRPKRKRRKKKRVGKRWWLLRVVWWRR